MKYIQDILSNYEEQPPTNCWEKLSGQLDEIMPSSEGVSSSASAAAQSATTTLTKAIIASIVGAVAVASIVIAALTHSKKDSPVNNTTTNSAYNNLLVDSTTSQKNEQISSYEVASKSTESFNPISDKEEVPDREISQISPVTSPTFSTEQVAPTEGKQSVAKVNSAVVPRAITPSQPSIPKATLPQHSIVVQNYKNDPVVQNLSEEENISWDPPVKIEIPNVFTPNGDGYNDYFVIKGIESCSKRQLIVRNRSGKIVFRSNNYENNWNGEECSDGTYTYQFFFSNNGIEQNLNGTVNIIRK